MRIKKSDSRFKEINRHNLMLCLLKNPQAHYNTNKEYRTADKPMWNAIISDVEDGLQELLDPNPFKEFIEEENFELR